MKITAVIAEYNPFHNGHAEHIKYIKEHTDCDKLLVLMSGNFTQRGENAVENKFVRAEWAIKSGADMVVELPSVFATANAEIFATGAVKLLTDLNSVNELCFGVESGSEDEYLSAAAALLDESKKFKAALKEELDSGVSFAKAKFTAVKRVFGDEIKDELLSSPNNILALEYAKAKLKIDSPMALVPVTRFGETSHNDKKASGKIGSALSIREALKTGDKKTVKKLVPDYVFKSLTASPYDFSQILMAALYTSSAEKLSEITDCTEGLENRIKALIKDTSSYDAAVEKIVTKRYTYARVKRITVNNLLNISEKLVLSALKTPLYAKVLAIRSDAKDMISEISVNSSIPLLTRKKDYAEVKKTAALCLETDDLSNDLYSLITKEKFNPYQMIIAD